MPHGDFSDTSAFTCAALGMTSIIAPQLWLMDTGIGLKPMIDAPASPEVLALIRFAGGLLMFLAPVLFVVRWNTINGKAAALGCTIIAVNSVAIALSLDEYAFVFRGWYIIAIFFLLAARHLAFNANPMLTSAMLLEKEAKKKAAKAT